MKKHWYTVIVIVIVLGLLGAACQSSPDQSGTALATDSTALAVSTDSIDTATGLIVDNALPIVVGNCTACHSAQLITQNRATREGWHSMIVWMQETQKLWDLGENEAVILDYLEKHYAPENIGRRRNLENIEWYDLGEIPS
uniref:Monoheme cytochrome C n=1 Tax=Roseihalotalea indica TaxID=2867963 RepID=A0AA49GMV2_9BACT|nr:hypothetical protein K4G66_03515 [Tunicatimonas sp. TK19036]